MATVCENDVTWAGSEGGNYVLWKGRCPLTGITDPALLRASHIVPWAKCETDAHRLDIHNGLLLSALWDAAFDAGLISFDDDGRPLSSTALTPIAAAQLNIKIASPLKLTDAHRTNLTRHRERYGFTVTPNQEAHA